MEVIIRALGRLFFLVNISIKRLLYFQILKDHTSIVSFILLSSFIISFTSYLITGFSFYESFLYSAIIEIGLFIVLLVIGASYEAQRLKKSQSGYSYRFVRSNLNGVALSEVGFSEKDNNNLTLVLNNLRPKEKIDFKLVYDNRIAADYKQLLRVLHLLIDGGINEYSKEQKYQLFTFIHDTFTLNGSVVNMASLRTRYSEWINEKDDEFELKVQVFRKFLL